MDDESRSMRTPSSNMGIAGVLDKQEGTSTISSSLAMNTETEECSLLIIME